MRTFISALLLTIIPILLTAQSKRANISGRVLDSRSGTPVEDVFVKVLGTQTYSITSVKGIFTLADQPLGNLKIEISLVGYKRIEQNIALSRDTVLNIYLEALSLDLKEVSIVARSQNTGSSSIIDKTAIRHTQPTSLFDALQLIPGQLSLNPDLSSAQQINLRQVPSTSDAARANALGTAILLDGIPFSNNANLQSNVNILNSSPGALPPFSSVAGRGNDLRQIPADQIERIEVIRGIPSARHGDLTSGAILVTTRAGVFAPQFTTRVNPNLIEQSAGFGTKFKGRGGILSFDNNLSYSQEDPRNSLSQYRRITSQLSWSRPFFSGDQFYITNRLAFLNTLDNVKQDPNDLRYQRKIFSRDQGFRFSSNGALNVNNSWFSSIQYNFGITYTDQRSFLQELVTRDLFPVSDAVSNTTKIGRYGESEYLSNVETNGRPLSLYGRIEGTIFRTLDKSANALENQLLIGLEYRQDGNSASGRQFDPTRPPRQNYSMGDRPRNYREIPTLRQLSYYLEDRLNGMLIDRPFIFSAGLRYDNIQPLNPLKGKFGAVLAPRLNFSVETIKHLRLKAGYGVTAKAPTLSFMYPGNRYFDLVNYNYYATNPEERLVVISTVVFDTANEKLKSYRSNKFEVGLDYENQGLLGYFTVFRESTSGAFGTDRQVQLLQVGKLQAVSFPRGRPPILDLKPVSYSPFFAAYDLSNNNRRIINTGAEFQFDSPSIHAIYTSFSLNGAYIKTVSFDDGDVVDANRAVFSDVTPSRVPVFRSGFGSQGRRFNTSLRFITRIPELKFLVSGLIQTVWVNRLSNINLSEYPVGYVTDTGETIQLSEAEARKEIYKDLRRSLSSSLQNTDNAPPLWLLNVRLTKEFKHGNSLSFYINNVLADRGTYFNAQSQLNVNRNQNLFFGAEFTINF